MTRKKKTKAVSLRIKPLRSQEASRLSRALRVSELVAQLLLNRGIETVETARKFLRPSLDDLHDPRILPDMDKAVERLARAIHAREKIVVFGDYDVDGVVGTALLVRCLGFLGANVGYHIPHRITEGYSLNPEAVKAIASEGARVIVTVDCGSTSHEEIELARELGLDVVVTDHHEPPADPPRPLALVNPKRPDSRYPFPRIAGSVMGFKLAWAVAEKLGGARLGTKEFRSFLQDAMALAALGTVADVVPLEDENRILVSFGLAAMGATENPGLQALLEASGCDRARVRSSDLAFRLVPRLNASGRLGSASLSVELLLGRSREEAKRLATELSQLNAERQLLEQKTVQEALSELSSSPDKAITVVGRDGWHPGVIGIVAARLVEEFHRPAVVIAFAGDRGRGSCRSVGNFSILEALTHCRSLLPEFGGHQQAAGFNIEKKNFESFKKRIEEVVSRTKGLQEETKEVEADAEIALASLTPKLVRELELVEPTGEGNPSVVFVTSSVKVDGEVRVIGKAANHISFTVEQAGVRARAVAFRGLPWKEPLEKHGSGSLVIAFTPLLNTWAGRTSVDLQIKHIWFEPPQGV